MLYTLVKEILSECPCCINLSNRVGHVCSVGYKLSVATFLKQESHIQMSQIYVCLKLQADQQTGWGGGMLNKPDGDGS